MVVHAVQVHFFFFPRFPHRSESGCAQPGLVWTLRCRLSTSSFSTSRCSTDTLLGARGAALRRGVLDRKFGRWNGSEDSGAETLAQSVPTPCRRSKRRKFGFPLAEFGERLWLMEPPLEKLKEVQSKVWLLVFCLRRDVVVDVDGRFRLLRTLKGTSFEDRWKTVSRSDFFLAGNF